MNTNPDWFHTGCPSHDIPRCQACSHRYFEEMVAARPEEITYTAFCQEIRDLGTVWIEAVGPYPNDMDIEQVKMDAINQCAAAWEMHAEDIHLLGLAYGDISIVHWEDQV